MNDKIQSGAKDASSQLPLPGMAVAPRAGSHVILPTALDYRPRHALSQLIEREAIRRRNRRTFWWIVAAAMPVLAAGIWYALQPAPVPFAERFRMQQAVRGDLVREVLATGNVAAVTTVQVGAEISGRIASVEVDYNSPVKAGQVLARIDPTALEAQLTQAEGALASAEAALDQARTDNERAATDLARAERLHASKLIADAEYEAAVTKALLARQRVDAASAQVAAQQGQTRLARFNLDRATIVSPIDGIVITRNIDPGQTVASVLQTPVLFTVAEDLRKMRVIAAVDEADIGEVKQGQNANFSVDAYPDRRFEGVVTEVRNSPVIVQDVVTYGTVIDVANPDLALKPGMTASVRIRTASAKDVLSVPVAALNFVPPGESAGKGPAVWVASEGSLHRVPVTRGISNGELTAVASNGLKPGDDVVVDFTPEGRRFYGLGR